MKAKLYDRSNVIREIVDCNDIDHIDNPCYEGDNVIAIHMRDHTRKLCDDFVFMFEEEENRYVWDAENCKLVNTSGKEVEKEKLTDEEAIINLFGEFQHKAVKETGLVYGYIRQVIRNFLNSLPELGNNYLKWEIVRIIEKAMKHKDDGVKAYARKLADKYNKEGYDKFANAILSAIGEKNVAMATMDDDQCTNEGIEELAKFIRGHLAEIPENAQKEFERIYTRTTGKKMYGGFKD